MEDPNRHVLDYANPRTLKAEANRVLWIAAGIAGVVLFFVVVILPESNRDRPSSQRWICSRNLRQIGQALLIYANESGGAYPNRIEDLLLTQNITSDVFTCPTSGDAEATGADALSIATDLTVGGHLSYLYLGRGVGTDSPANVVLACEWLSNHDGQGINVLFADGHAEWLDAKQARQVLDPVAAGAHPVVYPPPAVAPHH